MGHLFPINDALNAQHVAVLQVIAADLAWPMEAVYISDAASGPAVFYEDLQGSRGTRCICAVGSLYWQECQARAETGALLARL